MGDASKRSFFCIKSFKFIEIITKGIAYYGESFFGVHLFIEERSSAMQVINRLKMELSNQIYILQTSSISDSIYRIIYLKCHNLKVLTPKSKYSKINT